VDYAAAENVEDDVEIEAPAESFSVLNTAEAFGELGLILQRIEMAFGERINPSTPKNTA
jgi:hypothetical protein